MMKQPIKSLFFLLLGLVVLTTVGTAQPVRKGEKYLSLSAAIGGQFAIGGYLSTLTLGSLSRYVFGATGSGVGIPELVITPVPEPGSIVFVMLACMFGGRRAFRFGKS